jgi:NAD(P)-dependent dehydrogenase (short-subunit alcohol dehydrogenase family)
MSDETLRVFDGATAVVTGGASGIGRALTEELVKRGGEVVLADLQIQLAEEVVAAVRAAGGKARARKLDVADFSAVERLLQETVERTGRLDYMFNNAGIGIIGPIRLHSIEDWKWIVDVNLWGVIHGVHAAYQIMLDQGFGHIVNTASIGGLFPSPGSSSYSTTKHAVVGLSKCLRIEAATVGIRVSVLCPGFVCTPMLDGTGKSGKLVTARPLEQLLDEIEKVRPIPADAFARKALDQISKNKPIVVIPSWWRLFWWMNRLSPSLGIRMAQQQYEDV